MKSCLIHRLKIVCRGSAIRCGVYGTGTLCETGWAACHVWCSLDGPGLIGVEYSGEDFCSKGFQFESCCMSLKDGPYELASWTWYWHVGYSRQWTVDSWFWSLPDWTVCHPFCVISSPSLQSQKHPSSWQSVEECWGKHVALLGAVGDNKGLGFLHYWGLWPSSCHRS